MERETDGFLWRRKIAWLKVIQFTLIFLESFRMFQSRERVDPSAVPLLEKPNPVSKSKWHFTNVILMMMTVHFVW